MKDGNPFNTVPGNLELVTRAESTRRGAARSSQVLTDSYVASLLAYGNKKLRVQILERTELIEDYRKILLARRDLKSLKVTIKNKTNERQKFSGKAA